MYGLTFWLPTHADEPGAQTPSSRNNPVEDMTLSPDAPEIFMAAGAGDQRLYVIPELELVVVRQGNSQHFKDGDFLRRLLKGETEQ